MKKKSASPFIITGIIDVLILLAIMFVWTAANFHGTSDRSLPEKVSIIGEYSADGQEWTSMQLSEDYKSGRHSNVIIKGKLTQDVPKDQFLIISMCNVWTEVKANGKTVASNLDGPGAKTDTPGNSIAYIPSSDIPSNAEIELTLKNPYPEFSGLSPVESTLEKLSIGGREAMYNDLIQNNTMAIFLSLAIFFLGLFAFTLAGMLWKNVMHKNIALAFFAITGGLFVLTDSIYTYLPLWMSNPVLCMIFDEFTSYLLPIAAFLYIRVNMENRRSKALMSVVLLVCITMTITAFLLQLFGVTDILKFQIFIYPVIIAGVIASNIVLIYEAFKLKIANSRSVLLSLCPIIVSSLIDAVNSLTGFAPERVFMRLGLLLTVLIQLYLLFRETRQHQKELLRYHEMQNELLQMRVSIMVSQIQPHFLYNSLTSIAQLCEKDPSRAKKATIEFSEYLRRNMNSLKEQAPVPFANELKHLETYLSLEKMRFGDELNIEYDIETTDFLIPSLTVQPLVENAVKHGVGMLEDGGTVTIATREYPDRYEVIVSDNGVGFDPEKKPNDGRSHVGMENVRNRLKTMCNATLDIKSKIGEGTTATITIPKEE